MKKEKSSSNILFGNKNKDLAIALWVLIIGRTFYGLLHIFFMNNGPGIFINIILTDLILGFALFMSAKGYYRLPNLLAGMVLSISILSASYIDNGNIIHLFILVLPIILVSIQLEMLFVTAYSLFNIVLIIVFTLITGKINFSQASMPIFFILTVTGLLYLNVKYRHKNEEERINILFHTRDATIYALAYMAEMRDNNTGRHLERTSQYISILAKSLSKHEDFCNYITEEYIRDLEKAAILHDIGKVGVPDSILLKPASLSIQEFNEIKNHCEYGVRIIQKAQEKIRNKSIFDIAKELVHFHHEKWDGSGYPLGLNGSNIPISARLMSLVDVWDALRNERPYKKAFTPEKSKSIILNASEIHFDPLIVSLFVKNYTYFKDISINMEDESLSAY